LGLPSPQDDWQTLFPLRRIYRGIFGLRDNAFSQPAVILRANNFERLALPVRGMSQVQIWCAAHVFRHGRLSLVDRKCPLLRPLVESGQIQLGNHTWTHPDLTKLSTSQVADELGRTDAFLRNAYGVEAGTYFRPPYGHHNAVVDRVAADLGYQVPTLWCGDLRNPAVLSEDQIVKMAYQSFAPHNIVIGHLNHAPVTHVYGQLVDIIRSRRLRTVRLNDVFLRPEIPHRTPGFVG
jgi:hypothetical protein